MTCFAGTNAWSTKGPPGGFFVKTVANPNNTSILYAAYSRSLHKSSDSGDTWQTIREFKNQINDLVIEPTNGKIYVTVNAEGVFRSDDAGASFLQIAPASFSGPWGIAVAGSTVYYSNGDRSFYRSSNDGQTWSTRTPAPQSLPKILIDRTNTDSIFAFAGPYLLRSTDGGATWTQTTVTVGTPGASVRAVVMLSATTLVACAGDGFYLTNDSGATWTRNAVGNSCFGIAADPNTPGTILAGILTYSPAGPLYRSTDYGATWTPLAGVPYGPAEGIVFGSGTPAPIVVVNSQGAARSLNSGVSWNIASQGPIASSSSLATTVAANSKVYAYTLGATVGSAALYATSADNGWQRLNLSAAETLRNVTFGQATLAVKPGAPNSIYLGAFGNGLFRSDNGGAAWLAVGNGLLGFGINAIAFDPINAANMYAKVSSANNTPTAGLYRSTDSGANWLPQSASLPFGVYGQSLAIDPANPSHLYFGGYQGYSPAGYGGLYQSLDSGVNWTQQFVGQDVRSIAINPMNSNHLYVATSSGLQASIDGGVTFSANTPFSIITNQAAGSIAIDPTVPTTLYATSIDPGYSSVAAQRASYVLRSVDNGLSWETLRSEADTPYWLVGQMQLDPNIPSLIYLNAELHGVATFEVAPDLAITINGHAGTRAVGTQSALDIRANNLGPYAATMVRVVVSLPSALTEVSAGADRGTCTVAGNTVTCTLPLLRKDEAVNINVVYTPPVAMSLPVSAVVSAHERDLATNNNSVQSSATAGEVIDLSVALTPSVTSASNNDAITYTLSVSNNGPVTASNSTATLTPSSSLTLGIPPSDCTVSGVAMTCTTGSIAVGASRSFAIPATIIAPGAIAASAAVASIVVAVDTTPANNTVTATITAIPTGDLSVAITDTADPAIVGTTIEYQVLVRNAGPDEMPSVAAAIANTGTTLGVTATQGACASSSTGIACNLGAISSGANATITVQAMSSAAGSISLQATLSSAGTDRVTGNNSTQESTTINVLPPKNDSGSGGGGGGGLELQWLLALSLLLLSLQARGCFRTRLRSTQNQPRTQRATPQYQSTEAQHASVESASRFPYSQE